MVSVEDPPWLSHLQPCHPEYALFWWALGQQDAWDRKAHAEFWRNIGLPRWPRKRGNRSHTALLARWVDRWRQAGFSDQRIEDALNYQRDSLKRMGVLSEANSYREWLEAEKRERRAVLEAGEFPPIGRALISRGRLPRVVRTNDWQFEEGYEGLSYDALGEADARRREATLELVRRVDRELS